MRRQLIVHYKNLTVVYCFMLEVTLGIVKPHAYPYRDEIKLFIEERDMDVIVEKDECIPIEKAMEQYEPLRGKGYYEDAIRVLTEGRSAIFLIYGEDAIQRLIGIAGPTDSARAREEMALSGKRTIRGLFGEDKERNAFHRADSPESVLREVYLYFNKDEIPGYASDTLSNYCLSNY
jgi:nucleoside-diphosphate kinase